jgi:hypothetical protein
MTADDLREVLHEIEADLDQRRYRLRHRSASACSGSWWSCRLSRSSRASRAFGGSVRCLSGLWVAVWRAPKFGVLSADGEGLAESPPEPRIFQGSPQTSGNFLFVPASPCLTRAGRRTPNLFTWNPSPSRSPVLVARTGAGIHL